MEDLEANSRWNKESRKKLPRMNPGTNISITVTCKNGVLKSKRKTSIQVNIFVELKS